MKDIMTPKEWAWSENISEPENTIGWSEVIMEAYAQYYTRAVIESLTDEDINNYLRGMYPKPVSSHEIGKITGIKRGAKWAREELLKRIQ